MSLDAAWIHLTNWGSALLLMPLALAIAIGLVVDARLALAMRWSLAFAVGVLATLATKVAFLGWGIGIAALDFTGISGHAMLAASVLPFLMWWLAENRRATVRRGAVAIAAIAAVAIGVSRLVLDLHSPVEVVSGLAIGFAIAAIAKRGAPPREGPRVPRVLVAAAVLVAFALPFGRPVEGPHDLVTRIALGLSGRDTVYTRDALARRATTTQSFAGSKPVSL